VNKDDESPDPGPRTVTYPPASLPRGGATKAPSTDRFIIRRRLGEGGMGVVYEAFDQERHGSVALKTLKRFDGAALARFKREFRAMQGLAHPNLVALDELFFDDEQWFFTMELIDGVDFVSYARAAPTATSNDNTVPVGNAIFCDEYKLRAALRQLLEGLAELHAHDKVHRDIKPSNVLVTRNGRVVLLDFGLVADATAEDGVTSGSGVLGTPTYMAPEQAASREIGPAADLYAVGAMLYELLTGKVPHEGPLLQILVDKQTREPPAPASIAPGVPSDLNALCVKLLRFDPAQRPSAAEILHSLASASATPASPTPRSSSEQPPFVGRSAELGALRAAFESTVNGSPAVVLLCGESGIGKSYTVRRFTNEICAAHPETMVLEGRCYERETVPYKTVDGIVDALSRRLSRMPGNEVAALLPARSVALAQVFPVMLRIAEVAKQHVAVGKLLEPHELRQRAFLALRDLFTRVAVRRPTIIAIDDFQWADEDGLRVLAEILRPPDPPPVLLVGTVRARSDAADATLDRLRTALPGEVQLLELERLPHDQARELAAALCRRSGTQGADADWIASESGGHPLFVEELARHAALGGTAREEVKLDDAIWARVVQLEPTTRRMAELVAVAGKPLAQEIVAAAAHVEPAEFNRRAAILRTSNIVRTGGARWIDTIEPYHDRVREAVSAQLEPDHRRALHEMLAVAYEASSQRDPEALAVHWRDAGNRERAAAYAELAGERAAKTFAFDRAVQWYELAVELLGAEHASIRELRIKLGDALANAGRGALAARHLEAAAAEAAPMEALELRRRAAEQLLRSGRLEQGVQMSRAVLEAIGMRLPKSRLGTFAALIYYRLRLMLRGLGFRERERGQITSEQLIRIDICWSIGSTLGFVDSLLGAVFQMRALLLALAAGDLERVTRGVGMQIVGSAMFGGRTWRRTEKLIHYADELATRCGSRSARVDAMFPAGLALILSGRYHEADVQMMRILELLQEESLSGRVWERILARQHRMILCGHLGRFKELRRLHQEGMRDALARGDLFASITLRTSSASLAWLVEDRPDLAESHTRAALQEWAMPGANVMRITALMMQAQARLYQGDAGQAYALACEVLDVCRRSVYWRVQEMRIRITRLRAAAALAMVERGLGHREQLLAQVARDARSLEREGMAWSQPFVATLRAGISLRRGEPQTARVKLDEAAEQFEAAGMIAFALATRDRAARLRGDATAAQEIEGIAQQLREQEVASPERMVALLVPGMLA
jgi:serine/threonine protein kinase